MVHVSSAPSDVRFDPVWRGLHWLMAVLFLFNTGIGYYASTLVAGSGPRPTLLLIHKSTGVALFVLVLFRLLWRATHRNPHLPATFGPFTRVVSTLVHAALYVLMLGMPLSGYVASIASGHPFRWFGLFPVPDLVPQDKALSEIGDKVHFLGAYAVYVLVSLHIAAALWHGVRRDGVLSRMLPAPR